MNIVYSSFAFNFFVEIKIVRYVQLTAVHCAVAPDIDSIDVLPDITPRVFHSAITDRDFAVSIERRFSSGDIIYCFARHAGSRIKCFRRGRPRE